MALRANFAPGETIPPHDHEEASLASVTLGGMTDLGTGKALHPWECAYDAEPMIDPLRVSEHGLSVMILSLGPDWLNKNGFARIPFPRSFVTKSPDCQLALMRLHSVAVSSHGLVDLAAIDLVAVLSEMEIAGREPAAVIRRVIDRLEDRPEESVARLAKDVGYHPTYLARLFLRETGTTMTAFAQRVRLVRAAERVIEGKAKLSDVALDSGFYDQAHFSRKFTSAFGMSPRSFQKLHKVGFVQVSASGDV